MQAFDSRQVDPKTEVSGSGSVNKCSDCEEPKEKTPEVDRTRLFNYSERAEETSSSVEISTVLKGDQDSSDKSLIHRGRSSIYVYCVSIGPASSKGSRDLKMH